MSVRERQREENDNIIIIVKYLPEHTKEYCKYIKALAFLLKLVISTLALGYQTSS